jgi:hypothetical protein
MHRIVLLMRLGFHPPGLQVPELPQVRGGHNYAGRMQPTAGLVMGTVEAGPLYPVTMPDRPNTRPVPGAVVEALHDGDVVAATTTDDAGRYELRVPPGTYLIRARAEGRGPPPRQGARQDRDRLPRGASDRPACSRHGNPVP